MCPACYAHYSRQLKGLPLNEYLDGFDCPVLIVNGDGRMLASNLLAAQMLGKSEAEIVGLLGGEAMECEFARLPEGCGNTVHCETCTIRNTVMHTMTSRDAIKDAPVKLRKNGRLIHLFMSTNYMDGLVQIVIDQRMQSDIKTVLIVDDDPRVRRIMRKILEKEGLKVLEASNGQEGIDLFLRKAPDVVLMDIIMPRTDGFAAIGEIKKLDSSARLIAVSGGLVLTPESYLEEAIKLGADRVLSKPFGRQKLISTVNAMLA
jgi:two-component system, chemotaxis family, chemotaxis protein CheY